MNPVRSSRQTTPGWPLVWLILIMFSLIPPARAQLDICGCAGSPTSFGAFDSRNLATYPPGTQHGVRFISFPLPPDGVMVFDSFNLSVRDGSNGTDNDFGFLGTVNFIGNASNTPVTLLIKGNFTIDGSVDMYVSGA